jgi:hypothetical protein
MRDKYKELFEKGADTYIETLINIDWFDNPHIDKSEMMNKIKSCGYAPYFSTCLWQSILEVNCAYGEPFFEAFMNMICQFIPKSSYSFIKENDKLYIILTIDKNIYKTKIDMGDFEFLDGDDDNCILNYFINKMGLYIFVKPETYQKALKIGVIPEFMGYYAVNDY